MHNNLQSLIKAELAFAQTSKEKGMQHAFLSFLADDAIVFNPEPVRGKPLYAKKKKNDSGLLMWKPVFADISLSGDMGFTTGPYEYRENRKSDKADGFGHYVTIWKKQPDGKWAVVLDAGIYHSAHKMELADFPLPLYRKMGFGKSWKKVDVIQEQENLLKLERKISDLSMNGNIAAALKYHYADNIRFYRNGEFPITNKNDALLKQLQAESIATVNPLAAFVATSGDFGYTYGVFENNLKSAGDELPPKSSYLKIWKKQTDSDWKVVLDLTNHFPNAKSQREN